MDKEKSDIRPRVSELYKTKESNLFEGMISIRAIIETGCTSRKINRLLYASERIEKNRREFGWLRTMSDKFNFLIETPMRKLIDGIALGTTHGGVIAYCSDRSYPSLDRAFIERTRNNNFYVMIEGIEDPFNFGYALRSVYSSGADGIILSQRNWMSAAGVVCRSSAAASELCEIAVSESKKAVGIFRESGFRIICADMSENAVSAFNADLKAPLLLIIGGEKRGISKSLLEEADNVVCLEYGRDFPEALSSASAVSILSYEVLRQNRNALK